MKRNNFEDLDLDGRITLNGSSIRAVGGMDWIAQDRDRFLALVHAITNFSFSVICRENLG